MSDDKVFEEITVKVGSLVGLQSGQTADDRREVRFVGRELGYDTEYGFDNRGQRSEQRGVTWTLFETEDGRYVVHTRDWSHWRGEPNTYSLRPVTLDDLGPTGEFAHLGEECGLGRPLTLDEYLQGQGLEE